MTAVHRTTAPAALAGSFDHPFVLWGQRGLWLTRIRWFVAPLVLVGLWLARALGFEVATLPVVLVAAATLLYNSVFVAFSARFRHRLLVDPAFDRSLALAEVGADYVALFVLICSTGGVSSPLVAFLVLHVVISAIQLTARVAYLLAAAASAALWLLLLAQTSGWIELPRFAFAGRPLDLVDRPVLEAVLLLFFTLTLFVVAALTSHIMRRLRQRVDEVSRKSNDLAAANHRLRGLYRMITAIGPERSLQLVLSRVAEGLSKAASVPAVAVKLLDDDAATLRYVAVHGLPSRWIDSEVVHLERSPLNRRCIGGETLVFGRVDDEEALELRQEFKDLGFRAAVMAPLRIADRIFGTLGFYSPAPDAFDPGDTPFLQLAAELVAITIDNARAYEAVELLLRERAESMVEVAHNLRAPLTAGVSMLDLLTGRGPGELTDEQVEQLKRLIDRLVSLDRMIDDLLIITRSRDRSREIPDVVVDLESLARHTEETFRDEAARRQVEFDVVTESGLPSMPSGVDLLERVMENLVSNALKYTPAGGKVTVHFAPRGPQGARISVSDTGIGIPSDEQDQIFREFFRGSNARRLAGQGTGLGLALVKRAVERHGGRISVASREDEGTTVVVDLPGGRPERRLPELS